VNGDIAPHILKLGSR